MTLCELDFKQLVLGFYIHFRRISGRSLQYRPYADNQPLPLAYIVMRKKPHLMLGAKIATLYDPQSGKPGHIYTISFK